MVVVAYSMAEGQQAILVAPMDGTVKTINLDKDTKHVVLETVPIQQTKNEPKAKALTKYMIMQSTTRHTF